jgi:DNA-binding beta-propeller fold protein YncE
LIEVIPGQLAGQAAPTAPGYHLTRTIPVGGEGGWDYVAFDTVSRRLFVAHSSRVEVIDADQGRVVGAVAPTPGVHGIAIATDLGRGFTSNGAESSVTIFDLKTLKEVGRTKTTGAGPDAILYEPVTHRVLTFNGEGANATAIDGATGHVVGTIPLGGTPEFAVADGGGLVFANLEDKSAVLTIDPRSLTVTHAASLAPCQTPTGMAMDRVRRHLFIGCRNQLMAVMDADSGQVLATLPIGERVDANVYDPGTGLAFASNGDGTLTVVGPSGQEGYSVLETVTTRLGARTMTLDPKTHDVFLVTAELGPPPPPTPEHPHPRPSVLPGTFLVLVLGLPQPQ